jgi:hypothetical protein
MATRRSFGLFLLALAFLGLSVAAFVFARRATVDPVLIARLGMQPYLVTGFAIIAGAAGAAVAVGAWGRFRWVRASLVCWGLSVAAIMVALQTAKGAPPRPLWLRLFPYAALALLIGMLIRFTADSV